MEGRGVGANRARIEARDRCQKRPRRRSGVWRMQPSSTTIFFMAAVVMATISTIDAGASEAEIRPSHREQSRIQRQTTNAEDRRPRATTTVTDANWAGVAPPVWLWRHLDTMPRRLDAAEGRLARIEALIELRLDQMVEGERSRNAKEDLWRDQESRRIELSFDRLERRLAYMETRLADAATADRVATAAATPRLQEQLRCQQEKLEESVEGVRKALVEVVPSAVAAAIADKIKAPDMTHAPASTLSMNSHPPSSQQPVPCPSTEEQIENISKHASDTLEHLKQKLAEEFGLQAEKFVSKVGNMYNDLWQRAQSIETLLKDALVLGNSTQRDLHEGFRALVQQQQEQLQKLQQHSQQGQRERHGSHSLPNRRQGGASAHGQHSSQSRDSGKGEWSAGEALELGLGSLELSVDALSGTVARRLGELGRRLDSSFRMLLLAQNLFLESCHRIQLGEPTLEARLSIVLERLLDTVSNRSQGLNHEAVEIKEAINSQTSQIATKMKELESGITTVIREGNDWLLSEYLGENQRTNDEVLSLVKNLNGFGEETKPQLCTLFHENMNETNEAPDEDHTKDDGAWSKISSDISEPDFEFHHVSAVVKDTDTNENISVIASLQKRWQESTLVGDPINDTSGLEIHVENNPLSGLVSVSATNESHNTREVTDGEENHSVVNETFSKTKDISASTDPNVSIIDHEIPTTTNVDVYDLVHRVERRRSDENTTDSDVNSMEKEGNNETKQLQAIIGALTDHTSSLELKNITETPEIRASNSSIEEMKLILKNIILQIASEKNSIRDLKFNKTIDSALDDANLSHFIKAVFKIYKSQNLDLNLDSLKAKISKEMNTSEDLENLPELNAEHENILKLNGERDFNSTEAYIASYVKRIINLASKLDPNSSDSQL